jgi:hypothetical protein
MGATDIVSKRGGAAIDRVGILQDEARPGPSLHQNIAAGCA